MQEKPSDSFYFIVETTPKSKPRARSNGKVRFYAEDYQAFIQDSHGQLRQQWKGEPIETTVVLDVQMHGWHKGSDLDNLHGSIQDSLVRAKILKNDNLNNIDDFHSAWCKAESQERQRIEIWIQVDEERSKNGILKWAIEVNQILEKLGYDCLFNEDEIEALKQGDCAFRTFFQFKAERAWHKGFSAQQFVQKYAC